MANQRVVVLASRAGNRRGISSWDLVVGWRKDEPTRTRECGRRRSTSGQRLFFHHHDHDHDQHEIDCEHDWRARRPELRKI